MASGEWANQTEREAWTAFAVTAMRARPDEGYEAWCTAADCMLEEWRKRNAGIERIHEERVKAVLPAPPWTRCSASERARSASAPQRSFEHRPCARARPKTAPPTRVTVRGVTMATAPDMTVTVKLEVLGLCKSCRHWLAICKHGWEAGKHCESCPGRIAASGKQTGVCRRASAADGEPRDPDALMWGQDASDYRAGVCTKADFGCVMWEGKDG